MNRTYRNALIAAAATLAALAAVPTIAEAQQHPGMPPMEYCNLLADFSYATTLSRDAGVSYRQSRSVVLGGAEGPIRDDLLSVIDHSYKQPDLDAEQTAAGIYVICWTVYGESA